MSKYYAKTFVSWKEYSEWIKTTHDNVISIICGSTDNILITMESNRKLNEEL